MPIVRDLKRRDSNKILILTKGKNEQVKEPSKISSVAHRKIVDLKPKTPKKDEFIIFNKEMERWQEEYNLWENLKKATVLNPIL